jgi:hypothetical protein
MDRPLADARGTDGQPLTVPRPLGSGVIINFFTAPLIKGGQRSQGDREGDVLMSSTNERQPPEVLASFSPLKGGFAERLVI